MSAHETYPEQGSHSYHRLYGNTNYTQNEGKSVRFCFYDGVSAKTWLMDVFRFPCICAIFDFTATLTKNEGDRFCLPVNPSDPQRLNPSHPLPATIYIVLRCMQGDTRPVFLCLIFMFVLVCVFFSIFLDSFSGGLSGNGKPCRRPVSVVYVLGGLLFGLFCISEIIPQFGELVVCLTTGCRFPSVLDC